MKLFTVDTRNGEPRLHENEEAEEEEEEEAGARAEGADCLYVNQGAVARAGWSWLKAELLSVQREPLACLVQVSWSVEAPSPHDWIGLYFLREFLNYLI